MNVFFFFELTLQARGLPGFLFAGLVLGVRLDFFRLPRLIGLLPSVGSDDDQSMLSSFIATASFSSLTVKQERI